MSDENPPHRGIDFVDLSTNPVRPAPVEVSKPVSDPKQIAIAVKYERDKKEAPKIVATGKGAVAEQIMELAFAHGVKVREDADLAQLLSHLEVDSPIPLEAYTAVAEILAYVYKANANYIKK